MTNPPHLTEDPSAEDELPPAVAAQHQELPMPVEQPTRTSVPYADILAMAHRLDIPFSDAASVTKKMIESWDDREKYVKELEEQLDGGDE